MNYKILIRYGNTDSKIAQRLLVSKLYGAKDAAEFYFKWSALYTTKALYEYYKLNRKSKEKLEIFLLSAVNRWYMAGKKKSALKLAKLWLDKEKWTERIKAELKEMISIIEMQL